MDDSRIIELYFARDEEAVVQTKEKYQRLCHSIAQNILRNPQDAEECVNDTWLSVWNAIPPARPDNLSAFLCRITRNLSLKRVEHDTRQKRSATTVPLEELDNLLSDDSWATDRSEENVGQLIGSFLQAQSIETRRVFLRRYYFFDSIRDIARRYGYTESRVKTMLHRTRNKLKEFLIKEGVSL